MIRPDRKASAEVLGVIIAALWGMALLAGGLDSYRGQVIAYMALVLLNGAALLIFRRGSQFWSSLALVLTPLLAAIGWEALVTTRVLGNISAAPDLFLPGLLFQLAVLLAFALGALIGSSGVQPRVLLLSIVCVAMAVLALALTSRAMGIEGLAGVDAMRRGRFAGTLANANAACALFSVSALLAFGFAMNHGRPSLKSRDVSAFAAWIAFVAMSGACILTASRIGNVFLLVGLIIQITHHQRHRQRTEPTLSGLIAVLLLSGLVLLFARLLLLRLEIASDELSLREFMWEHYWSAALRSPLYGYGLGSFSAVNAQFMENPWDIQRLWMVNSPHNFLIQQTLIGGLPALALLLSSMILIAAQIIKAALEKRWTATEASLASALIVLLASGLVDIAFDMAIVALTTSFLTGLLWGTSRS